jgi:hypothetical protein
MFHVEITEKEFVYKCRLFPFVTSLCQRQGRRRFLIALSIDFSRYLLCRDRLEMTKIESAHIGVIEILDSP